MSLEGLVFGPGIPGTGANLPFSADAFGLNFAQPDMGTVSWSRIRWRRGGFNQAQLLLEWTAEAGDFSLALAHTDAQRAVLAYLTPTQQAAPRARVATRAWVWSLVGIFVALPLLALGVILWQSEHIIGWAVERIPVEAEKKLGAAAFNQFRMSHALLEQHSALPMLREVGARLTKGSAYTYQIHVVRDASVNAFAMPGGYVVFHTGLLEKAARAEEVAGVLAHEIQHVERRHSLRGMVFAAGLRVSLSLLLGDVGGSTAAKLAENLGQLRFSRAQETDADLRGAQALVAANIDPTGMVDFFRKLAQEGGSVPTLLSSHPASDARFETVLKSLPKARVYPALPYPIADIRGR